MDSHFSLTPKLQSFNNLCLINPLFPSTNSSPSFFKLRPFSTTCSYSKPHHSNPNHTNNKPFPLVKTIKKVAFSQTKKWVSRFRAYSDADKSENGFYLQNGGLGVALLSITTNAKVRISPFVATLAANPTFVSGLVAWIIAQSIKVFLNFFVERKWDLRLLFASGGMPSSHSALCTALTTSVALCHGVADSLFPVCLGFSLIVMYDAIGVRRHAGMQAQVTTRCSLFWEICMVPCNVRSISCCVV